MKTTTVKIKEFICKYSRFVEHEDGSITKEVTSVTLEGARFSPAGIVKQIPRDARVISADWVETSYIVPSETLKKFCVENQII